MGRALRRQGLGGLVADDGDRIVLGEVIWLAYFLQSNRVRATFVAD